MENVLIIKTKATGDVLRTSVLLNVLQGNIFWITAAYNIPLFPDNHPNLTLIPAENIPAWIFELSFETVINLEEDEELARLVSSISCGKIIGVFWRNDRLDYSADSGEWFDMSLITKMPGPIADKLKRENIFSYQEIVCRMLGKHFNGEGYIAYSDNRTDINSRTRVGIEKRVGRTWPTKQWHGYEELKEILESEGHVVTVFKQRDTLREYMDDIHNCNLIVCGDTLAMHVALAYKIPCIAIFNCTSPAEIFSYDILSKITSPFLFDAFYKRNEIAEVINSIRVGDVYNEVIKIFSTSTSSAL